MTPPAPAVSLKSVKTSYAVTSYPVSSHLLSVFKKGGSKKEGGNESALICSGFHAFKNKEIKYAGYGKRGRGVLELT